MMRCNVCANEFDGRDLNDGMCGKCAANRGNVYSLDEARRQRTPPAADEWIERPFDAILDDEDTLTAGKLADVCDILFEDGNRAEAHGYDGVLERARGLVAEVKALREGRADVTVARVMSDLQEARASEQEARERVSKAERAIEALADAAGMYDRGDGFDEQDPDDVAKLVTAVKELREQRDEAALELRCALGDRTAAMNGWTPHMGPGGWKRTTADGRFELRVDRTGFAIYERAKGLVQVWDIPRGVVAGPRMLQKLCEDAAGKRVEER